MDTSSVLAFCLAAAVLIAVPGPSVVFVVSRSVVFGRRTGLLTVLGNAAGEWIHVVVVAIGVGAVVAASATAFTVIKVAGGLYLIGLGVMTLRRPRQADPHAIPTPATRRTLADAFMVGVLNPKTLVFLAAFLPQFVAPGQWAPTVQMLILGAIFVGIALVLDSCWALAANRARGLIMRSA